MPPQGPPFGKNLSNTKNAAIANAAPASTLASGRRRTFPEIVTGSPGHRSSIIHTSEAKIIVTPVSAAIIVPGNKKTSIITNETPSAKSRTGSCPDRPATW